MAALSSTTIERKEKEKKEEEKGGPWERKATLVAYHLYPNNADVELEYNAKKGTNRLRVPSLVCSMYQQNGTEEIDIPFHMTAIPPAEHKCKRKPQHWHEIEWEAKEDARFTIFFTASSVSWSRGHKLKRNEATDDVTVSQWFTVTLAQCQCLGSAPWHVSDKRIALKFFDATPSQTRLIWETIIATLGSTSGSREAMSTLTLPGPPTHLRQRRRPPPHALEVETKRTGRPSVRMKMDRKGEEEEKEEIKTSGESKSESKEESKDRKPPYEAEVAYHVLLKLPSLEKGYSPICSGKMFYIRKVDKEHVEGGNNDLLKRIIQQDSSSIRSSFPTPVVAFSEKSLEGAEWIRIGREIAVETEAAPWSVTRTESPIQVTVRQTDVPKAEILSAFETELSHTIRAPAVDIPRPYLTGDVADVNLLTCHSRYRIGPLSHDFFETRRFHVQAAGNQEEEEDEDREDIEDALNRWHAFEVQLVHTGSRPEICILQLSLTELVGEKTRRCGADGPKYHAVWPPAIFNPHSDCFEWQLNLSPSSTTTTTADIEPYSFVISVRKYDSCRH